MFSDESRIRVGFTDNQARVWRMRSEPFAHVCIAGHDRYGGVSVMVCASINVQGKTARYIVQNGTLTAEMYVNEVHDAYVHPYSGPNCIFMGVIGRVANVYLKTAAIVRMD